MIPTQVTNPLGGLSTTTYRESIQTCVASYVKKSILDPQRRAEIKDSLKRKVPHVTSNFAVTAIVDISGYTAITSRLSEIGKIASEVVSKTVGEFLDQVILVISRFGGDVVKFLGDAILVCFSKSDSELEQSVKERAFLCCLYISIKLRYLTIDLELAIQESRKFTSEISSESSYQRTSFVAEPKSVQLQIHVALSEGLIDNVIMGDSDIRLDYCINGPSLKQLGDILDATKSGELGISADMYDDIIPATSHSLAFESPHGFKVFSEQALQSLYNSMEPQISMVLSDLEQLDHLQTTTAIPDTANTVNPEALKDEDEAFNMLELFVNQALIQKLRSGKEVTQPITIIQHPTVQFRPPTRSKTHLVLKTVKVTSEFRAVSVVFVKLLSSFDPQKAHIVMSAFVKILRRWEGVFQQYSVDDKGQTLLALFGLPPLTHDKDPLNALKAALDFENFCKQNSKAAGDVSIAVATGELLFSLLASGERRDASLLGDVVNVSARLMSLDLPNATVRCDKATFNITNQDVHLTSLGVHSVKGKSEPVEIWSACLKTKANGHAAASPPTNSMEMFGYLQEKEFLRSALSNWKSSMASQKIVVEGPSGVGKSRLLNYLCHQTVDVGLKYCDEGNLDFRTKNAESKLGGEIATLTSSIMAQYDRLDKCIQEILLKASILGQYFSLEDLSVLLKGEKTVEELEKMIEEFDTFRYLIKQESDVETDDSLEHLYYFRHIQLMQALYSSQSFADKSANHLEAAIYFENGLDANNRENLLPIVTYHYQRTSNVEKQIKYLEELGIQNFQRGHIIESASYLESLIDLVSQHSDKVQIEAERKAKWLALLAVQKVSGGVYTIEQYERAVLALRLIGAGWPKDSNEVGKAILRSAMALYRLWKATKGGTRKLPKSTDCFGKEKQLTYYQVPPNDSVLETMIQAYRAIFRLGLFSTHIDKKSKLLVMLSQCCAVILYGHRDKGKWAGILYWASFGLSTSLRPVSKIFWKQAEKMETIIDNDADREDLQGYYQYKGYYFVQNAKFTEALKAFDLALRYFEKRGDLSNKIISMCYLSVIGMSSGNISSHEKLLLELANEKDYFQIVHMMLLTNRKMVTTDLQETQTRQQRTKDMAKSYPPNVMFDHILLVHDSWIHMQNGDFKRALDCFESASKGMHSLQHSAAPGHNAFIVIGILSWMLSGPFEQREDTTYELSEMDRGRLLESVNEVLKTTDTLVEKRKVRFLSIPHLMLKSCRLFLLNQKRKATGLFLAALKSRDSVGIMNEMKATKAYVYSILGLYLNNEADRQYYLREAVRMYQEFGFTYMEMWLVWADQHVR
ncbi:hypothetical protein HDV05_004608 [Chytridiales sp. JEL 0842]|nr:hypothetical protein HDV05_004608 [Chytridiales sp. JEL 0842]